jgi:hypothetical protein
MKIRMAAAGAEPRWVLYRYAVVNGQEKPRGEVALAIKLRIGEDIRVKFDALGPKFTTYLLDQPVDFWTDEQFKAGGFGFANERDERAQARSVQMSFLKSARHK